MAETASEYLARRRKELTGQSNGSAETGESYLARRRRELSGEVQTRESQTSKLALKERTLEPHIAPQPDPVGIDFKAAQSNQNVSPFQDKLPAANMLQTGQGIQSTLQGKVPAANLVQQTGRGPENASQIPGISQYNTTKKEIAADNAPEIVKAYANLMNYITQGNPLGVAASRSFAGNSGATRRDSTGNATVDKVTDVINNFVTPFITPTGAPVGQGIIGSSYDATGRALSGKVGQKILSGAEKIIPGSQNVARVAATEGIAGGIQGAEFGVQQGQDSGKEIVRNALLGAAAGGVIGGAGAVIGEKVAPLLERFRKSGIPDAEIADIAPELLALPEAQPRTIRKQLAGEIKTTPSSEPIATPYTFKLGEATPDTQAASSARQAANREAVRVLDPLSDTRYQQSVINEYKRLKADPNNNLNYKQTYDLAVKNMESKKPVNSLVETKLKDTRITGKSNYTGEPIIRNPQTPSREQEIMNKVNTKQPLTQEDIDFALSDQFDKAKMLPDSTLTESTYVKPRTVKTEVAKVEPKAEVKLAAKKTIVTEVKKETKTSAVPEKKTPGIRANFKTMTDSKAISPTLKGKIAKLDQRYEVSKNADIVAKANENVKDLDFAADAYLGAKKSSAEHVATGYRLMQELDKLGKHEKALNVAERLAKDLTEAGQTVQAASLISRLSPEGQLLNLIRTAEKNGKVVELADKVKFQELATKVQKTTGSGKEENSIIDILNRLEQGGASADDIKTLGDYLKSAESKIAAKPKGEVTNKLSKELRDVRKRDKVISFLEAQEAAAQARINKRRGRLNSLPVEEWIDYSILIAAKVGKGVIKAETYVEDLVKLFGEDIKPIARQVFEKAQEIANSVSKGAASGDLAKANAAFRKVSGQAEAEKAIVKETAAHVRQLIEDAKNGNLTQDGVQKLRDYSDEIAEMLADKKSPIVHSDEQKYLQKVKQLAKKIAEVEGTKTPTTQDNREISNLLRQLTNITDGVPVKTKPDLKLNQALSDIAHDVMEVTRPTPKPTTLQEKIVEKYIKQSAKDGIEISPKDIESLRKLSKSLTDLKGLERTKADMAMQKILNSYEKSSIMDKINAVRYIAMLYNSGTQLINGLSGPAMATTARVADIFGMMIDSSLSTIMKKPRTTTLYGGNPVKFVAEYLKALKTGAKAGWEGVNPAGIHGANEIRGLTYKGKYNPLSYLERSLGAVAKGADYATYSAIYKGEMEKQGFLDALQNGIKRGDKEGIKRHIRKFINDPPEEALEQADRIAKNSTFQRNDTLGGETANWLNSGSGKVQTVVSPVVRTVFPFVRTPINIASTAVTMTPGGIIKGLIQLSSKSNATQREAIRTLSLGLTGTGLSAVGYYLNQLGIITGSNDSGDKNVDNIREQVGKGKYRFNTSALQRYVAALLDGQGADAAAKAAKYQEGDKQFDYNKLQPLAFPLAIGAEASTLKGKPNQVTGTVSGAAGSLYGMSTLKGLQDLVGTNNTENTQGEKAINIFSRLGESFLKSFSPSMLAQEARRQDPIVRKTTYNDGIVADVSSYYKSRIPGLSQSLPANKTTLGQNKLNAPGIMGQYVNPYKSEVARYTQAGQFIVDLMERTGDTSIAPKPPEKKVRGKNENDESVTISIPQKRYEQLQEEIGNEIINRVMEIEGGTDEELVTQLEDIYSEVRKEYMDEVKEELGLQVN
ncbi:hypothetical protein D3C81_174090 [compost metagenome]